MENKEKKGKHNIEMAANKIRKSRKSELKDTVSRESQEEKEETRCD